MLTLFILMGQKNEAEAKTGNQVKFLHKRKS